MKQRMSELGEFGLIEEIKKSVRLGRDVLEGPGDDCAVVRKDRLSYGLLTADMLVENVDFRRSDDPALIGQKAINICVSDIAACAGSPRFCLASAGLPRSLSVDFARRLCAGMLQTAGKWGVSLVGGDISRSRELVIDVSMYGDVRKKDLVLRRGARPGDFIFVTGKLGGSSKGRHLSFTPRLREAQQLVRKVKVRAMIDISDGLVQDLGHLAASSRVGAVLYSALIPQHRDARGLDDALYTGEDFELLYAVSCADAKRLLAQKLPFALPVGQIVERRNGVSLVDKSGKVRPLDVHRGYSHF